METGITIKKSNDYRFQPIRQIKEKMPERIFEGFAALIFQIYSVVGQRISTEDAKSLAAALAEDCTKRYCSLSMADISKALNDGARGLFGDTFVTPSLKLFNQWLTYYRKTYVPVVAVPKIDESRTLPQISHEEAIKFQLERLKSWHQKHDTLINFFAQPIFADVYLWLEKTGQIIIDNEEKIVIYETAKKHIFNRMQLNASNKNELKEANRLSDIVKGIISPELDDEIKIKRLVKRDCYRICIEKYLRKEEIN